YRGFISVDEAIDAILGRSQDKISIPNEIILALIKREIDNHRGKALFIDGFPRTMDQVSYSLFFRDLVDYREDPDVFISIDIPEMVINERMKSRVVCPKCQTPRNLKLFTTKEVGYDEEKNEFYLKCDNEGCEGARMIKKDGDDAGIESIRDRLDADQKIIDKTFSLHGIPRIFLRNAVPVDRADELVDKYEITPEYYYELDKKNKKVNILEKPWSIKDDEGVEVNSLLAPPVVLSLVKQLSKALGL
ncbi:MAG: nucleoside monophosphate kinase, partial [Candidatus Moranbacteria bacterium]|nr:nucleoside monophosphate kinase [Candidatus Moranbacteria bacterium]